MAADELPPDGPSIAPPTLGFRRRKKAATPDHEPLPEPHAAVEETQPIAAVEPVTEAPAAPAAPHRTVFGRTARPTAGVVPGPEPAPSPEPFPTPAPVPTPQPEPTPEPVPTPTPGRDPVAPPAPVREPEPVPAPEPAPQPAIFTESPGWRADDEPRFEDTAVITTRPAPAGPVHEPEPVTRRRRLSEVAGPAWFVGFAAAGLVGAVVGLLVVAGTAGGFEVCTAVQGTSSCGRAGLFLLLAILLAAGLAGATLLRIARMPDAGSTSFLAVGLMAVLALMFLVGSLFEWWMVIAIPVLGAATYVLSHWVTTRVVATDT